MNSVFVLLLTFTTIVSGSGHETPQQVVTRYNNYKTICTGLGYQNVLCKAGNADTAFQSSLTKTLQNLKHQETVIFDKVLLNEGKAYNKNTGIFTATVEGVYFFSWTMYSDAGKYFITEIVHNGTPITCNYCDGRGRNAGYVMTSSQANIKMKKGDKVWIRTQSNYGLYARAGGGYYCNFSGFKV